jgi:hypothetical protein
MEETDKIMEATSDLVTHALQRTEQIDELLVKSEDLDAKAKFFAKTTKKRC